VMGDLQSFVNVSLGWPYAAGDKADPNSLMARRVVYAAQVPFIYGGYDAPNPALPSLIENEGYILSPSVMTLMAALYDPTGEHTTNPLAWPYYAKEEDLRGLPPHVVTTDEIDPLRDEGLAFLRALQRAGVDATGHTYSGVGHACEQLMGAFVPDLFERALHDVVDFARGVSRTLD